MPKARIYKVGTTKIYHKTTIPKALREQVWKRYIGDRYNSKCTITWCKNTISAFDFHVGHDIPESKGGTIEITNLHPICSRCNLSMGSNYSIGEWNQIGGKQRGWSRFFMCLKFW